MINDDLLKPIILNLSNFGIKKQFAFTAAERKLTTLRLLSVDYDCDW